MVSRGAEKQPVIVVHDLTASVTDSGGQTGVIPIHSGLNLIFIRSSQNTLYIMFVHFVHLCMAYVWMRPFLPVCVCVCTSACVSGEGWELGGMEL